MSGNRVGDEVDMASEVSSRRHVDNVPYVHKVGVPPKKSLFEEFKFTFKETFFHDDPLRPFKDQPKSKKMLLGIQAVFPILEWGRRYKLHMFKGDLIAGLTIASLCIPQALPQLTNTNKVGQIMDPALEGQYPTKEVVQVATIAAMCVQPEADYRPLMADVVQSLVPLVKHHNGLSKAATCSSFHAAQSPKAL